MEAGRPLSQPRAACGDSPTWTTLAGTPHPAQRPLPAPGYLLRSAPRPAPRPPPPPESATGSARRIASAQPPSQPLQRGASKAPGAVRRAACAGPGRVLLTKDAAAEGEVRVQEAAGSRPGWGSPDLGYI